uniref:CCHC-type domain-containing protein n=1 Tax=Cannabis sativa TaxID=3483 RepID=A0A803PZY6_CANSA
MSQSKTLEQNLDEFLRFHIELANSGENEALSDENQAIIILNSLLESYRKVKTTIKYGRTEITLEEVISALISKDLELKVEKLGHSNGDVNLSSGRPTQKKSWQNRGRSTSRGSHKRNNHHSKGRSNSKGTKDPNGCYHCGKLGHFKRECYFYKRSNGKSSTDHQEESNKQNMTKNDYQNANLSDGYNSGDVYIFASSFKDDWIIDSSCTFHMTNNKSYLFDYRKSRGGKVILGND